MLNKGKYARNVEDKAKRNQKRLMQLLAEQGTKHRHRGVFHHRTSTLIIRLLRPWLNELDRLLTGVTLALGDFRQLLGHSNTCSNLQVIENAAAPLINAMQLLILLWLEGWETRCVACSHLKKSDMGKLGRTNISCFFMRW
ncbi:hypothetical protein GOODEAATRI_023568 [Goodea atripinnis]|uniref:Uncharacterized protein n=1 Tax=Goodea atripinnis TaxID=208336 RepID=A0ABV0PGF0_9TELE